MIKLVWFVVIATADGPVAGKVPEYVTFPNKEQCQSFGEEMTPRMKDYIRGVVKGEWDQPVEVAFQCGAGGQPV